MLLVSRLKQEWRELKSLFARSSPAVPAKLVAPLRSMADVDRFIVEAGFEAAASLIRERALPCVYVYADSMQTTLEFGATRFGGVPDIQESSDSRESTPLQFLAQINMDDLRLAIGQHSPALPQLSGLLRLFANEEGDEVIAKITQSLTAPSNKNNATQDWHLAIKSDRELRPVGVRFEFAISLPSTSDQLFDQELMKLCPQGDSDALQAHAGLPDDALAQLFGRSAGMMDDFQESAALDELGFRGNSSLLHWENWEAWEQAKKIRGKMANGLVVASWYATDDDNVRWLLANRERIAAETKEWQLLFALSSNREMGFSINDADTLYVFIRNSDLAKADFSRVRTYASQS